jgi:hypothetical protein
MSDGPNGMAPKTRQKRAKNALNTLIFTLFLTKNSYPA